MKRRFKFGRVCGYSDRHNEDVSLQQVDIDPPALPIYLADNEGTPGLDEQTRGVTTGYYGALNAAEMLERERIYRIRHYRVTRHK